MYSEKHLKRPGNSPVVFRALNAALVAIAASVMFCALPSLAQSAAAIKTRSRRKRNPARASKTRCRRPQADRRAIPVRSPFPRRATRRKPPPPPKPKPTDKTPEYSLHVDVPEVTVDAHVLAKDGRALALPVDVAKEHFRIWEDGVPQKIQSVTVSKAPITAVLLVEFAATNYNFMYDALNSSYAFASSLQPQDWVAVVEFDMKTHILVDFTQDKQAIFGALNSLRVPGFSRDQHLRCHVRHAGSSRSHARTQRTGDRRQRPRYFQQDHAG